MKATVPQAELRLSRDLGRISLDRFARRARIEYNGYICQLATCPDSVFRDIIDTFAPQDWHDERVVFFLGREHIDMISRWYIIRALVLARYAKNMTALPFADVPSFARAEEVRG